MPQQLPGLVFATAFQNEKTFVIWPTMSDTGFQSTEVLYIMHFTFVNTDTNLPDSININAFPKSFVGVDPSNIPDVAEAFGFYKGNNKDIVAMDTVNGKAVSPRIVPQDADIRIG